MHDKTLTLTRNTYDSRSHKHGLISELIDDIDLEVIALDNDLNVSKNQTRSLLAMNILCYL